LTGSGIRPLDRPCGEQGKLPSAKALMLAERDKTMSEQKALGYTQQLKRWTYSTIVDPLRDETKTEFDEKTVESICEAIRLKMLESYRNGLKAAGRPYPSKAAEGRPAYAHAMRNLRG